MGHDDGSNLVGLEVTFTCKNRGYVKNCRPLSSCQISWPTFWPCTSKIPRALQLEITYSVLPTVLDGAGTLAYLFISGSILFSYHSCNRFRHKHTVT
jgi:hypothetical protein